MNIKVYLSGGMNESNWQQEVIDSVGKDGYIYFNPREHFLSKSTTHFLLIRLAYKGDLKGNSDNFKDYTYPKELVSKLEERKSRLEDDLENLNKRES